MTTYRELIERLEGRGRSRRNAAAALRNANAIGHAAAEEVEARLFEEAASALRALEAQSKDKEEGE